MQRVNDMIDAMRQTSRAAGQVRDALSQTTAAIADARTRLEPLVAQYDTAANKTAPGLGRQTPRELNERAREVLVAADRTVALASVNAAVPMPAYDRLIGTGVVESTSSSAGGSGPGSGAVVEGGAGGMTSSRLARLADLRVPQMFDPPTALRDPDDGGYSLSGEQTVGNSDRSGAALPSRADPTGQYRPFAHGGPVAVPAVIGIDPPAAVRGPASGRLTGPASSDGSVGGRGVLPAQTGVSGVAGRRVDGPRATRRAPTISPPVSPRETDGRAASGVYRDRSFEEYAARRRQRGDQDNEVWPMPEGVAPLLEAPAEAVHDPGPGILGLDR